MRKSAPNRRDFLKATGAAVVAGAAISREDGTVDAQQAMPARFSAPAIENVRIGYVGELGYELYVPQEFGAHVHSLLWAAGDMHGIANAGYRAIDSCRMEKGYLYWSGDISPDYNPFEAGLSFCVNLDKGDFIGRDALVNIKQHGVARKLCSFTIDGFAPLHAGEAILFDGKVVSSTTSVGFGHTLGKTIAFGYLASAIANEKTFTIEAFGKSYTAARGARCLYDAKMQRLKA